MPDDEPHFRVPEEKTIVTPSAEVITDHMRVRVLVEPSQAEVDGLQTAMPPFPGLVALVEVYGAALLYQTQTNNASVRAFVSALREAVEFAESLEPAVDDPEGE